MAPFLVFCRVFADDSERVFGESRRYRDVSVFGLELKIQDERSAVDAIENGPRCIWRRLYFM